MEEAVITALPQLGIAGAAILALVYTVKYLTDANRSEREVNQRAFREFVESNNHKVTDLVLESTIAIKESSKFIGEATTAMKNFSEDFRDAIRDARSK